MNFMNVVMASYNSMNVQSNDNLLNNISEVD